MGPLQGIRVVEFAGLGPGPFCAMMLADMGADVVRVDRPGGGGPRRPPDVFNPGRFGVLDRGRRSIALDLKRPGDVATARALVDRAHALIEGFRPGVMERLGLGPDECLERNARLVYGRMTGWGQTGPLAQAAGHDINYIALSGALDAIGPGKGGPVVPLNLVGDFGGGAMMLAFGIVCGLLEARTSGRGQVVDAAMTDGSALLMSMIYGLKAMGQWSGDRGANLLDGGAHFYDTYECLDGLFVAVGAIEPKFYSLLLSTCGIEDGGPGDHMDPARWPAMKEKVAAALKTKTRQEWCKLLEGTDACLSPILSMDEAPRHPHNRARETFVEVGGVVQPAPAPRFSRTRPQIRRPPARPDADREAILRDWDVATSGENFPGGFVA